MEGLLKQNLLFPDKPEDSSSNFFIPHAKSKASAMAYSSF